MLITLMGQRVKEVFATVHRESSFHMFKDFFSFNFINY